MRTRRGLVVAALVAALLCPVVAAVGRDGSSAPSRSSSAARLPLHVVRGSQPYIADSAGRQVLLRGVNTNQLGDYFQADPALPSTVPLTDDDIAQMAALGSNSIRLIVHWSLLEPRRGFIDEAYIARVAEAVRWAQNH